MATYSLNCFLKNEAHYTAWTCDKKIAERNPLGYFLVTPCSQGQAKNLAAKMRLLKRQLKIDRGCLVGIIRPPIYVVPGRNRHTIGVQHFKPEPALHHNG